MYYFIQIFLVAFSLSLFQKMYNISTLDLFIQFFHSFSVVYSEKLNFVVKLIGSLRFANSLTRKTHWQVITVITVNLVEKAIPY